MSTLFRFELDTTGDLTCSRCLKRYTVQWTTEYGDAQVGIHDHKTPCCNMNITFEVSIHYTQYPQAETAAGAGAPVV